jgi:translocation and assembly module TamB
VRPPDPTIRVIGPGAPAVPAAADQNAAANARTVGDGDPPPAREADAEDGTTPTPGLYDRAAVRIDISVPHNAWLRRSDTEIELRGSLRVEKDAGEALRVAGEIDAVRGWYTFQGRKFTVEEGTVTLSGQDLNPLLAVTAVYEAPDYTIRVRIGGTLRRPTLELESEPPLEQADILSVLVFGRPVDQLNQGESQGLRERALSLASGYAAAEFRRDVADALGLDTLEIEPGSEGLASTAASVGKYITDDIFVSLSHTFAEENVQQLRVEYFITPRWTIETTADTAGDSGIDVFWRRRY